MDGHKRVYVVRLSLSILCGSPKCALYARAGANIENWHRKALTARMQNSLDAGRQRSILETMMFSLGQKQNDPTRNSEISRASYD